MAAVTKFAYLKDLLEPKVRARIDDLPFSSQGYERAKNILKNKCGKISEIVNGYVQNIMGLPVTQRKSILLSALLQCSSSRDTGQTKRS